MANDCGLLRQEDMPAFKQWLDLGGIGWNPGTGLWEVIRSPETLRPLIQCFREYQLKEVPVVVEITDTERLEFMMCKGRKVETEVTGWTESCICYEIYVTEGSMEDRKYSAVDHNAPERLIASSDEAMILKRQAIDLAITESKETK